MSFTDATYELLDFGAGRKLERFSSIVLDRPSPSAAGIRKTRSETWLSATARYERTHADQGVWTPTPDDWIPGKWHFAHQGPSPIQLQLDALPSGQVGVFPEQRANWDWIADSIAKRHLPGGSPLRVLNLFAYTGGSTLAAAAAGAEVVHVDAARSIVERARENAELSGLADRPIRWITEDAMRFCQREVKRGNQYDAVILDPPTYGHGPKGEPWKISQHLLPLLKLCGQLTAERRTFVLVTCHTSGIGPAELAAYLAEGIFGHCAQPPKSGELFVKTSDGRKLPSGTFARWPA
jgi:23S rRNA (cytosine1962-C5)-methyltransferase